MNSPKIKLNEQWLSGAIESELIGCILYYRHIVGYSFAILNEAEPGYFTVQIKIELPDEWEYFHIKGITAETTIEGLAHMTSLVCDRINAWIDRSI